MSQIAKDLIFNTQALPYILQNDYFSLAWGKKQKGYFTLPSGLRYHYDQPKDWRFYTSQSYEENPPISQVWGHETNGEISPEDLFHNLNLCRRGSRLRTLFGGIYLSEEELNSLLQSNVEGHQGATDAGIESKSIYIYDSDSRFYKRILLSCTGVMELSNTSHVAEALTSNS